MNTADSKRTALQLPNIRRFIAFRVLFNSRLYYPVFTVVFLDFGLTLEQFAILNAAWAATIVALEVPSGALADIIGRKNLVVASAAIMVVELALLSFAPMGATTIVFYLFLANRILSGAAEAAASGADEALAYDTLKNAGLESHWPDVLEKQMRYQSIGFVVAMSLGALLYDYDLINGWLESATIDWRLSKEVSMRLPLVFTLLLGCGALIATLGMQEQRDPEAASDQGPAHPIRRAFAKTFEAGRWIAQTPAALIVILGAMLFDHVIRMVLTLNSQYYRLIELPEASFGFIGSALALLGIVMPRIGRGMARRFQPWQSYFILGGASLVGLWWMGRFTPIVGAVPMAILYAVFFLSSYFLSHYLNAIASSGMRATVLSFKGLSYNLAYGAIGLLYYAYVSFQREQAAGALESEQEVESFLFKEALRQFPWYFLVLFAAILIFAWLRRPRIEEAAKGGRGRPSPSD